MPSKSGGKNTSRTCVSLLFLEYSRSACSRACSKNMSLFFRGESFQQRKRERERERERERGGGDVRERERAKSGEQKQRSTLFSSLSLSLFSLLVFFFSPYLSRSSRVRPSPMAHDEAMTERKEGRTRTKRRTRKASPKKWTKRKEGVERSRRRLVFLCSLPPFPPPHRPALKLSVYKFDVTNTLTKQENDNQVVHRTQARVENINQDLPQVPRKFSGFLFRFSLSDQKRERMWYSGRTVPCQRARKSSLALSCRTEQTRVRFTACVFFLSLLL